MREYQTDMMQMPLVRQFITDDEVNADLTRGSGFSGGKARIYNYWQENHSAKEKMDFLKHEYGTGGHSHACSGATHSGQDHDAKGIAYTKSGCDKLQMSWAQVVQRIDGLMRKGRYLSPEEEAERQAIEEAKTDPLEDVYIMTIFGIVVRVKPICKRMLTTTRTRRRCSWCRRISGNKLTFHILRCLVASVPIGTLESDLWCSDISKRT